MTDHNIDFSMVLASAVHDMKNSLGMLLNTLDELRTEHEESLSGSSKFNMLQYEAERMHNDLVQLLGIYRLGENNLSAHIDEHFVPDFLSEHMARHVPLLDGLGIDYAIEADDINGFFDDDLLTGVLNNTINNAYLKHYMLLDVLCFVLFCFVKSKGLIFHVMRNVSNVEAQIFRIFCVKFAPNFRMYICLRFSRQPCSELRPARRTF